MRSLLARYCMIYPVHFLRGERVPFHHSEIRLVDRLTPAELHRFQEKKMTELLKRCYTKNLYYKRILKDYADPRILKFPFTFFEKLPFLTKDIVRNEMGKKVVHIWERLDCRSTSGSTGSPLVFWKDRSATSYMEAVQNSAFNWHGIPTGAPQGRFWGMPDGVQGHLARIKDRIKNRVRLSAFDLRESAMEAFYVRLCHFRPNYFYGYPSLILEFARYIKKKKLSLSCIPLKVAIGTGEYVYSNEKEELEELLRIPFVMEYGCTETGVIGFDCEHGKMHLMASNIWLEVVDDAGNPLSKGNEGEFVVTELNASFFPFIRYRLGDRGRFVDEVCPCGRSLPILHIAAGRKDDYIITPEGNKVYDAILAYTIKKGVIRFRAVQNKIDHLQIFVCPDSQFTNEVERDCITRLQQTLSSSMRIEIIRVEEIEQEKSGKLRYFQSKLNGGE